MSFVPELRFEWDPRKSASNRRKHGVSFEEAETAFADERALLLDDPDHSSDEERFSARKADRGEEETYGGKTRR